MSHEAEDHDVAEEVIYERLRGISKPRPEEEIIPPWRIQINFTGISDNNAENLVEILEAVIEEGERRGFFYEFATITAMDEVDVVPGSMLEAAMRGLS